MSYLGDLAKNTPSASNITAYANIVRERAILRQLIGVANDIAESAFHTEGRSSDDVLDEAERKVFEIAEARPKEGGPQYVNPILKGAVERIDQLFRSDSAITGISTGFTDLDNRTAGMQKSDLIIVAGRPSMGKTTFAMNIVENAAVIGDAPILLSLIHI